jgi:hypothetical protein
MIGQTIAHYRIVKKLGEGDGSSLQGRGPDPAPLRYPGFLPFLQSLSSSTDTIPADILVCGQYFAFGLTLSSAVDPRRGQGGGWP